MAAAMLFTADIQNVTRLPKRTSLEDKPDNGGNEYGSDCPE